MKKLLLLLLSHVVVGLIGFAIGIYVLPILTAPPAPTAEEVSDAARTAEFSAQFRRDLKGSDALHWGDGELSIGPQAITLRGSISPGPDYKLYLSPQFVETEAEFSRAKLKMVQVGDVRTFDNFVVNVPASIDPRAYNTVVIWCESFAEFITAARYQ